MTGSKVPGKHFFGRLGHKLGYKRLEDWYNITTDDISKFGGDRLLDTHFNSSPVKALKTIYPEYDWMIWRFKRVPKGYWERVGKGVCEQKRMLDWLGEQLSIKSLDEWYRVSMMQV